MSVDQSRTADRVHSGAEIVNKTIHNFKTKIGTQYSTKDVLKVWDCISKWIENILSQDKGILIKGIGYFTVAQWVVSESKVRPYTIRKPVFVIDEKLAKDFNLKRRRAYNSGTIRERYFNVLSVAKDFQLNIDMVTHCFKEVVVTFRKCLYEEKNCELPFPKIGKLQIKNKMVTMKFYREFLERQNQHFKNRMDEEQKKLQAINYNPDWDEDLYENRKRPCSAMSTISRPASSLSQYRPGTGYEGVLPTNRPSSSQSVHSAADEGVCRQDSRLSLKRPGSAMSVISRPASALSQCRMETDHEDVSPSSYRPSSRQPGCSNDQIGCRPGSSLSVRSNDQIGCRPSSSLSVRSNDQIGCRPSSSLSVCSDTSREKIRPLSRTFVPSARLDDRPVSRLRTMSCDEIYRARPTSRSSQQDRPSSRTSVRSVRSNCTVSGHKKFPTKSVEKCNGRDVSPAESPKSEPRTVVCCTPKPKEIEQCDGAGKPTLIFGRDKDETLCHACNVREYRMGQINNIYPNASSAGDRDNFMKGDNPLNTLLNPDIQNKRKDQVKKIATYNYNAANKLLNTSEKEKTFENYFFKQRPTEKPAQTELLKRLCDERIKNIEAKNKSRENYLALVDESLKIREEQKKMDLPVTQAYIFGLDETKLNKINNCKRRQIAIDQLQQKNARNLEIREQKENDIDFERCLMNKLKEKDITLQSHLLQKKLHQKNFLSEEATKMLCERRKNEIPASYPMSFPLKKTANRCRLCKKNGLGFLVEKISDFMR